MEGNGRGHVTFVHAYLLLLCLSRLGRSILSRHPTLSKYMNEPGPSSAYYRRFAQQADGPIRPPSPPGSPLLPPTQTTAQFLDSEAEDSLYAVLNVEHDASLAELNDKYRALAAIYHPDKQPDDVRRRAAHDRFMEISRAYEILTDPGKRAIYDLFGEEGLRTSWEVGPRGMTPAEMKAHYQRQGDTKRRIDVEALVNSKVSCRLGGVELTCPERHVGYS